MDLPWVKLIWDSYYNDDSLPGQKKKGSFWWKDIVKLRDTFKKLASVKVADGSTVLFWTDSWNGQPLHSACPELYSFAKDKESSFKKALSHPHLINNFHLPLTIQAHQQFQELTISLHQLQPQGDRDQWTYVWGNSIFTASRAYKEIIGHRAVHPFFLAIWKSKCQMKHKVFFWLLLRGRLSTRELLRRRNMDLESYTCDLCILQKIESVAHLFLRCNFAKACWASIGVRVITTRPLLNIFRQIKDKLQVPIYMEIIILMAWSIWTTRNDWIFKEIDPIVDSCKRHFMAEMFLLSHRTKPELAAAVETWLQSL
ncbi:ML domain protein isoform X2 [Panicum miliaceum]|uniref:ML domain protein isoform X2 n=1 Tax=Panicum miliaceum TaxID=4540 RepID=A0A3L6R5L8_PANMI|nr:ML domain protein isoform X2 [Panicum miliaceum]